MKEWAKQVLRENIVTLVFLVLCVFGFIVSGQKFSYVLFEVTGRLFRNFGLVFSLIIPVIAGIGLNFGIVLGAMAAQAGYIFVTHWRIQGLPALALAVVICTLLSILFGWLLGKLFNKTKGQEMITGIITSFFANGLYQMFFLVLLGSIIPMTDDRIMIYTGVGIKDTLKLEASVANALDNVLKIRLDQIAGPIFGIAVLVLVYLTYKTLKNKRSDYKNKLLVLVFYSVCLAVAVWFCVNDKNVKFALRFTKIPVVLLILLVLFGLLINAILHTKLGQDFRAIGANMKVAAGAGIDVDKTRIIAIILSTIMASWGQIIFLQNIGNFTTYSSHEKVGLFAVAAILVGGASTKKATVKQGIIGIILFHTLFVIAPLAGKALLNDAAYGEYFREAISYGVITLSLVLHISGRSRKKKRPSHGGIINV